MSADQKKRLLDLAADWKRRAKNREQLVKAQQDHTETQWTDHRADVYRLCASDLETLIDTITQGARR